MKLVNKLMMGWLVLGFIFWIFYLAAVEFKYQFIYYLFIILFVGIPIWIYRERIKYSLRNWKRGNLAKFLILGYGFVLFEEIFAALFNHLSEGFNPVLYLGRIGQFWALNIIIFTGFYLGWYFLLKKFQYSYTEIFFTAGTWGLIAERVIYNLFSNPLYVLFLAPVMIFVYGIMITFPMLSIPLEGRRRLNPFLKFLLSLLVIFIFSVVPLLLLQLLRTNFPWAFPPVSFVPM